MRRERGKSFPCPFQTNHLSTWPDVTRSRGNKLQNDGCELTIWNDNFGTPSADIVHVAGGVVTDQKRG